VQILYWQLNRRCKHQPMASSLQTRTRGDFIYLSEKDLKTGTINLAERLVPNKETTKAVLIIRKDANNIQILKAYDYKQK
jgi:hypothetical protein